MNRRILIAGIPGTGKTTIGDYLEKEYKFIHTDMECRLEDIRANSLQEIIERSKTFINKIIDKEKSIVVTWGFNPDLIDVINLFEKYDFKMVWFGGDKETARKKFANRESVYGTEHLKKRLGDFDQQMQRIESSGVVNHIKNVEIIDRFTSEGEFVAIEKISKMLI